LAAKEEKDWIYGAGIVAWLISNVAYTAHAEKRLREVGAAMRH
jgi:hypothetical protein